MRYTAREIAQEQDEAKRAAMLLANLIFDIRGEVIRIGRVDDQTPAEDVIEQDEMAACQIDWSGSEALGVVKLLLDHLGVRSVDASVCEDCVEGRTQQDGGPRQINPCADPNSENLAVIWLLAEKIAGEADPEAVAALIMETRYGLRAEMTGSCHNCGEKDGIEIDEDGIRYCRNCDLVLDHLVEGCDECKEES